MSFSKTDEEIIASYKEGNREMFKILIERYTSPIYNFISRLSNRNNVSDIVQETFIKAWKNLHNFDSSKASFKTWIFTIAKNITVDFLRKKKSMNFTDLENDNEDNSFSENIPDENLMPDEALQKLQDKELLNNLLEKLPLEYKTIIVLHYQEEMTFDEIGKILNKPLNTIKSYHRRAIIKLRKML